MLVRLETPIIIQNSTPLEIQLSDTIQQKVDASWKEYIKENPSCWDGDVFIVQDIDLEENVLTISKTKFSCLMYSAKGLGLKMRSLFAAILLKTKDDKYVTIIDQHNTHSIVGGMADKKDFENGVFNPNLCIIREAMEEVGINLNNKEQTIEYQLKYLKVPANDENYYPVGLIYVGNINMTSIEFTDYLKKNKNKLDGEVKSCSFFSIEELLSLDPDNTAFFYLREFAELETEKGYNKKR